MFFCLVFAFLGILCFCFKRVLPVEAFREYLIVRFWRRILSNGVMKVVGLCNISLSSVVLSI